MNKVNEASPASETSDVERVVMCRRLKGEEIITITMTIRRRAAEHAVEIVDEQSDEGSSNCPYPASPEWCEFQTALSNAVKSATSST